MNSFARDVRFACRLLAARPGWTLAAILCLAIATGANTAAFAVVNALILRPLPFEEPDRLVMVALKEPERSDTRPFSLIEYRDVATRAEDTVALVARTFLPVALAALDGAQMVEAEFVSGNYFDVLRVAPAAGRFFDTAADRTGAVPEVVISHALWQRRFESDPSVVGQVVRVNGRPVTVSGVAPRGFVGATRLIAADLWLPASSSAAVAKAADAERTLTFGVMGRMAAGVTRDHVRAGLDAIVAGVWRDRGITPPPVTVVDAAAGFGVPPAARRTVASGSALLYGLMGMLMAVAGANVAALVLARASGRHQEIGMRVSLGASRGRIARQMLTESLVLTVAGAAAGWLLAVWVTRIIAARSVTPWDYVSYAVDIRLDARALAYTTLAALATTVLVGLAPVLHSARLDLIDVLKRSTSSGRARATSRTLRVLVVGQIAVSTALLVGSGLLVRTYLKAQGVDPGIDTHNLVAASVDMHHLGAGTGDGRRLFDELETRLLAVPGVSGVGLTRTTPLAPGSTTVRIWADEIAGATDSGPHAASSEIVTSEYFEILDVPLVQGRPFDVAEPTLPLVAIVNETMAWRLWPDGSPLGRSFRVDGPSAEPIQVIGVARDVRIPGRNGTSQSVFYQPFSQVYSPRMTLLVRTPVDHVQLEAVRREIQATNGDLAIESFRTLDDQREAAIAPRRQAAVALSFISLLGLLLSSLGLYGVVSYSVSQRAREFGVRLALGARAADVRWMVLRQGFRMAALGLVLGLALSLAITRVLQGVLFGVGTRDPVTIVMVSAVLAGVTFVALYLPARWATTVDPAATLRSE